LRADASLSILTSIIEDIMMTIMRTTLTLDDDVAERLADLSRETRKPFKAVVNEALRRGLGETLPKEPPFHVKPHPLNLLPGIGDRGFNELAWSFDEEQLLRPSTTKPGRRK
jgi:hypothetical protein